MIIYRHSRGVTLESKTMIFQLNASLYAAMAPYIDLATYNKPVSGFLISRVFSLLATRAYLSS